jgi:hypothetical protein
MGREFESGARGNPGRGHASGRSSGAGGRSPFNGSNRSNGNNSGMPAKKPATLEYKFTLKKEGKVQTTFASMVMKITNSIQQTYDGGSYVATSLTELKRCVIQQPPQVYAAADMTYQRCG